MNHDVLLDFCVHTICKLVVLLHNTQLLGRRPLMDFPDTVPIHHTTIHNHYRDSPGSSACGGIYHNENFSIWGPVVKLGDLVPHYVGVPRQSALVALALLVRKDLSDTDRMDLLWCEAMSEYHVDFYRDSTSK